MIKTFDLKALVHILEYGNMDEKIHMEYSGGSLIHKLEVANNTLFIESDFSGSGLVGLSHKDIYMELKSIYEQNGNMNILFRYSDIEKEHLSGIKSVFRQDDILIFDICLNVNKEIIFNKTYNQWYFRDSDMISLYFLSKNNIELIIKKDINNILELTIINKHNLYPTKIKYYSCIYELITDKDLIFITENAIPNKNMIELIKHY